MPLHTPVTSGYDSTHESSMILYNSGHKFLMAYRKTSN